MNEVGPTDKPTREVPQRWIDEVILALDSASIIAARSCRPGDGLDLGNHDRLIIEARPWSAYARAAQSLPRENGAREWRPTGNVHCWLDCGCGGY